MKKFLSAILLASALTIPAGQAIATDKPADNTQQTKCQCQSKDAMRKQFEQRLNLTEKQKQKAAQIHKQGREQMKPVMMNLDLKRQELEMIKLSKLSERAQQEKITELNAEIKDLEKQAQEIRKKNTQEFENLLNKKQKAELEKMKAEGRARFEQNHPPRAPFQGLGTPNFLFRPLLPPPAQYNKNF